MFGGEVSKLIRMSEMAGPNMLVAPADMNKIMHIALPIGTNTLMGNDVPEFLGKVSETEDRLKISISVESKEEADKLFNGLSAGESIEMPIGDSPWGMYFAMFRDKFGIEWIVEFEGKEEIKPPRGIPGETFLMRKER